MAEVKFLPGDIVYFKTAAKGIRKDSLHCKWNGHGVGLLLGAVGPFGGEITRAHLFPLMAAHGFITFDDVREFLGDAALADCLEKFKAKYVGMTKPSAQSVVTEARHE